MPTPHAEPADLVAAARAELGSGYRHKARGECSSSGLAYYDAWGLIASVLNSPVDPERVGQGVAGRMTAASALLSMDLEPVALSGMRAGDVLAFDFDGLIHVAVLSSTDGPEPRIIHAFWGRSVVESWMGPYWTKRLYSAWRPMTAERVQAANDVLSKVAA